MKAIVLFVFLAMVPAFAEQPKFVIADVHASTTSTAFAFNFGGALREGLYVNRDATLLNLIKEAYGVSEDNIAGGPRWVSSDRFDVIAKVPDGTTKATVNQMLQNLLADRFGLVIHQGMHPVPRYVLTVAKSGSKLTPASESGKPGCQQQQQPAGGGNSSDPNQMQNVKVSCRDLTAAGIAENLREMAPGYIDHDVIDSTNLEGSWDFDLEWTPRGLLSAKGASGISVFDAVVKQLGLKLDLQNLDQPSLLIERVNRKPTENSPDVATALALAAPRFEVASIKLANPDHPLQGFIYTGGSEIRGGGTLRFLLALAFQIWPNVADEIIVGLPKSADTQRWEITAKLPNTGEGAPNMAGTRPTPPPLSVALEMLRALLVEDFELKTHSERREVTVYALTPGGSKPKLNPADDSDQAGCKPDPTAPKPFTNIETMIACKNTSMSELAQNLERMAPAYIDHPVVDATGLEGGWNFLIGWTPKARLQPVQAPNPSASAASSNPPAEAAADAPEPNGITIFEAVDKELGLKLVKQKRSIPVIVVDHVDEKPLQ